MFIRHLAFTLVSNTLGTAAIGCAAPTEGEQADTSEAAISSGVENQVYISKVYNAFLGRPADPAAAYWVGRLNNGESRYEVVRGIVVSQEGQDRVRDFDSLGNVNAIRELYVRLLGREPDGPGLEYWLGVQRGFTTSSVALGILLSEEFAAR